MVAAYSLTKLVVMQGHRQRGYGGRGRRCIVAPLRFRMIILEYNQLP